MNLVRYTNKSNNDKAHKDNNIRFLFVQGKLSPSDFKYTILSIYNNGKIM